MNDNIPADIVAKFQAKYDWLKSKQGGVPTLKGAIEPGIYKTPDGGWQCNYIGAWGYGCAITLRLGDIEPHEVHGEICKRWYQEGGAFDENGKRGWLGYPLSDEESYEGDGNPADRISHFENGDIIWSENTKKARTVKKNNKGMTALNPRRQEIIKPLEGIRSLVKRQDNGLTDSRVIDMKRNIDSLKRSICYDRYRVTVFGAFSAGKSTLLNALMGADYLPTADLPTTNVTTEIFRSEQFYVFMPNCDMTKAQAKALQDEVSKEISCGTFLDNLERDGQTISGIGVGFQPDDSKGFRQVIAQLASEQSCHEKGLSKFKKRIKDGSSTVLQLGIPNLPEWLGEITLTDAPGAGSVYDGHETIIDDIIPKTQLVLYVVESPKAGSSVDEWLCNRIVNNCRRKVFFILNQIDRQNCDELADALAELKEHIPSVKPGSDDEPAPPRPEFLKTSALCEVIANRLSDGSLTIKDLLSNTKIPLQKLLVSDEWDAARNDKEKREVAIRFLREQSQFDKLLERIKSYLHEENKELPFCEMAASLVKDCGQGLEDVCRETIATIQAEKSEKELEGKQRELHRLREEKANEAKSVLEDFRESALRPETGILSKVENNLAVIPDTVTKELEKALEDKSEFKRLTADKCKELNNWLTAKVSDRIDPICRRVDRELRQQGKNLLAQLRPILKEIDDNTLGRQFTPVLPEDIVGSKIDENGDTTMPTIVASAASGAVTATALGVAFGGGAGLAGLAGSAGFGVLAGKLSALGLGTVGLGLGPIILIAGVVVGIIAIFMPDWLRKRICNKVVAKTRSELTKQIVGDNNDSVVKKLKAKIEEFVNGYVDEYSNKLKKSLKDMDDQEEQIIADVAKARNDKQTRIRTLESFRKEVKSFVESSIQTLRELNPSKEPVHG